MQVHHVQSLQLSSSVVTIGALDGVHLGHQVLIKRAKAKAMSLGVPLVVYTCDPPPKVFFHGVQQLTPIEEKLQRLALLGVDHTVVAPLNEQFVNRSDESFIEELSQFMPKEIWVGPDFRFGNIKTGSIQALSEKFKVKVIGPVRCKQKEIISSSRIRHLIEQKRNMEAKVLLGWSFPGSALKFHMFTDCAN